MAADVVKPKPATIRLMEREGGETDWTLREMSAMVTKHHAHLGEATIEIVYKLNWSDDAEGNTPLGVATLIPELYWRLLNDRSAGEHEPPDFILQLNGKLWDRLDEKQKRYVLDEMLSFCGVKEDKQGEQAEDDTGRKLWRINKPDFAGFGGPLARHGAQLKSIKTFLKAAKKGAQRSLFDEAEEGSATVTTGDLNRREEATTH